MEKLRHHWTGICWSDEVIQQAVPSRLGAMEKIQSTEKWGQNLKYGTSMYSFHKIA